MITIDVDASASNEAFDKLVARLGSMQPAMDAMGTTLLRRVQGGFTAQRDPYGNAWEPLKDSTMSLRARRKVPSRQILLDTGAMYRSLVHIPTSDSVSLYIGEFAHVHQVGNPTNRMFGKHPAPIPARPILPVRDGQVDLPDEWVSDINRIMGALIHGASDGSTA